MADKRWHVIFAEEFDEAEARAIGAFAGYMSARGEDLHVTAVLQSAFRRGVSEAFNAGFRLGSTSVTPGVAAHPNEGDPNDQ